MRGTVKFFDKSKGWGFITNSEEKDIFLHYSNINMPPFKTLHEDDIVEFEIGKGKDGKEQAINVTPIITLKMIKDALRKEGLYLKKVKDIHGVEKYITVDINNVIQSHEQGMYFLELAAYAGIDVEGLE